ncbi:MAG: CpsD/CapB family tyrosine-protein kinase [Pseudomonadota bacterium]
MEKIKQALEIARQNQSEPVSTEGRGSAGTSLEQIVYTHTRRLELDATYLERHRILVQPQEKGADAYNLLRTQVLQKMRVNHWQTLAITSPNEGAGKTVTAINLAISLAREVNQTVLLVDLDLRKPSVAKCLYSDQVAGIGEYLMDDVPLQELLINPNDIDRLVILPGSTPFLSSSEMLSSPKMVALAEELKSRYPSRLVLFDMPPVLACDDVLAFAPHFDAALLVIEESVTHKDDIERAIELLDPSNLLGTVLNKSSIGNKPY